MTDPGAAQRGPYTLLERIGSGGTARVFRARHADGGAAAVKVLTPRAGTDPERLRRALVSEVAAGGRLVHPQVVRVFDMGLEPEPWLAMELCDGPLRDVQPEELPEVAAQLLDALAHAHARGVLHRDIKPANILRRGRQLKLADFGLAAAIDGAHPGVAGTPAYMAPEQLAGRWDAQGPWTDLFALGRTLQALFAAPPLPWRTWLAGLCAEAPADRFASAAHALHAMPRSAPEGDGGEAPAGDASTRPVDTLFTLPGLQPGPPVPAGAPSAERLPFPEDWRRREDLPSMRAERAPAPLLFGRLALAFVGREDERDALWAELRRARAGETRWIGLGGPPGVGRTALGDWLARRAHELGCAEVHRAVPAAWPSERTALVWLDGPDDATLAAAQDAHGAPGGALVVVELDDGASWPHARLELGPLPAAHLYELVHQAARVSAAQAELVVVRSDGNPGFAVELLEGGSDPSGDARAVDLAEGVGAALLGALGPRFRSAEWSSLCASTGADATLLERAHGRGLLELRGGLWRFRNPRTPAALLAAVSEDERARAHRAVASRATDDGDRGLHLLEGGDVPAAQPLLLSAASAAVTARRYRRAEVLLDAHDRAQPPDAAAVEASLLRFEMAVWRGDRARQQDLAEWAWSRSRELNDEVRGRALVAVMRADHAAGRSAEGVARAEAEGPLLDRLTGTSTLGRICLMAAQLAFRAEPDPTPWLDRAAEAYGAAGDAAGVAETCGVRGFFLSWSGDRAAGEAWLERSVELYEGADAPAGYARALNGLGTSYVRGGEGDRAEPFFERAEAVQRALDGQGWTYPATNLGLLRIAQGRLDEARAKLEAVVGATTGRQRSVELCARSGLLLIAARRRDVSGWETQIARLEGERHPPHTAEQIREAVAWIEQVDDGLRPGPDDAPRARALLERP